MQKLTYKSLELQTYLKSPIFDHESATMLFALRTTDPKQEMLSAV